MALPDALGERALRRLGVVVVPLANRPTITSTVTVDAVAVTALQELGVIAAEETPTPSDMALARSKVQAVHAALAGAASVFWADTAIPAQVAEEYAKLTAIQASSSFGKTADPASLALFEARVKRFATITYAPEMATNAVMDVHRGLVATGFAHWTSQDIPPAAEEPYVILACVALGPQFGAQFDPRLGVQAQQQLRRIIALPTSGVAVQAEYF